jgi:hypothetical protein
MRGLDEDDLTLTSIHHMDDFMSVCLNMNIGFNTLSMVNTNFFDLVPQMISAI